MVILGRGGDADDDRGRRGNGGAPPRPAQQPLSTDLANIVNAATSATNPRHPADLVRAACHVATGHRFVLAVLAVRATLLACLPTDSAVCAARGRAGYHCQKWNQGSIEGCCYQHCHSEYGVC